MIFYNQLFKINIFFIFLFCHACAFGQVKTTRLTIGADFSYTQIRASDNEVDLKYGAFLLFRPYIGIISSNRLSIFYRYSTSILERISYSCCDQNATGKESNLSSLTLNSLDIKIDIDQKPKAKLRHYLTFSISYINYTQSYINYAQKEYRGAGYSLAMWFLFEKKINPMLYWKIIEAGPAINTGNIGYFNTFSFDIQTGFYLRLRIKEP